MFLGQNIHCKSGACAKYLSQEHKYGKLVYIQPKLVILANVGRIHFLRETHEWLWRLNVTRCGCWASIGMKKSSKWVKSLYWVNDPFFPHFVCDWRNLINIISNCGKVCSLSSFGLTWNPNSRVLQGRPVFDSYIHPIQFQRCVSNKILSLSHQMECFLNLWNWFHTSIRENTLKKERVGPLRNNMGSTKLLSVSFKVNQSYLVTASWIFW